MQYSVGEKVMARINKIQDNGCYCSLQHGQYGFMPNNLMPSFLDENGCIMKNVGDSINVVISKITEKGILLSDILTYEEEQEKLRKKELRKTQIARNIDFISKYDIGTVLEADVVKVSNSKVIINLAGVQGIIKKEDMNWNEVDRLGDLLFEGETINAVYIGHKNNQPYFNIKYLSEKPYEDCLYDLSLKDLLKFAGHSTNVFIGQAKQYHYGLFIENLYSDATNQMGKLLVDPIYGYNLRAIVPGPNFNVEENKFYRITLKLQQKNKRLERNQLFQFYSTDFEEVANPYKNDVNLAFQRNTTNPASNQRDAKLLDEIGKNMYSSKDRMFFELIQNADDAASQRGVLVNVKTEGDYLVLKHNGYSFDKDDFVSITTAANGTKKANENKTGYKGIGFKSVFTDSVQVYINTGGYHFKFDRNEPVFLDFDKFYFENNPMIINDESRRQFLKLYSDYKKHFDGIHSIPWQLEPIWVDEFPAELGDDFTLSNVAIALRLGESKIGGMNGYSQAIDDIIKNPKFMLFLRNTKRIDFNGKFVSKNVKDGVIVLKNSFDANRIEYFKREDFDVAVNNEVFEENGIDIRIKIEEQEEENGKVIEAKFVDLNNMELENIPKKIAINNSTAISFAIPIESNGGIKPNVNYGDISMFAFLPTLVKDFRFPFYINANFILDPPRQRILGDNPWNFYLMREIAICMVNWCAKLNKKQDKNALNILVPHYFDDSIADTRQLAEYFNNSYRTALESEKFILNHNEKLASQNEIIIDKSGLSDIVGASLFCQLMGTEKCLPSDKISSEILEKDIFEYIEILEFSEVVDNITNNSDFNDWFINSSEEQKGLLYKWFSNNKSSKNCNEKIKILVNNLPLFKFGDEYKSHKEIEGNGYVVTTEQVEPIRGILSKIGFNCSDNLFDENHPLREFITLQSEKKLFDSIKECDFSELDVVERKKMFISLMDFDGVGDAKLKEIALFKNMNGELKPLGEMAISDTLSVDWLKSFLIDRKEIFEENQKYLIQNDNVFSEFVKSQYFDLEKIPINEVYKIFRDHWTPLLTQKLIRECGATEQLMEIVEQGGGADQVFVKEFGRIDLNSASNKGTVEYRVIKLALSSGYDVVKLKKDIYIDGHNLSEFTISDDVFIKISDKEYHFSLSKIIPNQFQYTGLNRAKELLSDIPGNDALFSFSMMPINDVRNQLKELRTPEQYGFYICYNIAYRQWHNIAISDELFVSNVLSYFFENRIDVLSKYMTYFTNQSIVGKFINSDDVTLESERLSPIIRKWANSEEKEKFLISLGVKSQLSDEIKRRKSFIKDEPVLWSNTIGIVAEFTSFLNWCSKLETPFVKENQVAFLKEVFARLSTPNKYLFYWTDDYKDAVEWDDIRYVQYIKNKLPIYCVKGEMPIRCVYQNVHLYTDYDGNYVCFRNPDTLYVNANGPSIESILMSVCDDRSISFTKEDWTRLFMVSVDTLNERENEIKILSEENMKKEMLLQEKEAQLEKYRAKYGELVDDGLVEGGNDSSNVDYSDGITNMHRNAQDEISAMSGKIIERDGLSIEKQIAAHKEAEQIVRKKLESDGYDCSNWILEDNDGKSLLKWQSVNQVDNIISPNGENISLVIKSAKGGYIYLSATDFEFLTSSSCNVLMVWDGRNVHSVTAEDIFNKDSNVNLIFDTEYTPKHYFAALSKVFQYVKRTTFAVKNPTYNAYDTIKTFGMDAKTEGVQELFDDNDL